MSPPARPAFASGSAAKVMPSTAGHISAPPTPISARAPSSTGSDGASAAIAENSAKIPAPTKNIRRRPKLSARRPPVTMSTPKTSA
jgi:hypothetical protein